LDTWIDQKLEIIEFNDQQIQRFMTSWQKDMPTEKSIEHFFRTLQERPQIMALARNPLLLTMVAYLYTDTEFALPHSRSEFYSRSTNLLLDQWKLERNRYKATHKRIVLQKLALFNQTKTGNKGERRTLELAEVLKEVRDVLPDLTLKAEDAQPMLDEIVQRSGLMLAIDGGARYQFTHLTLQEYFAARALETGQKKLLDFYHANPDAWREVVRLWCALEHDSTAVLKELYALDPVMAFECLSDAQQVDNAYADELVESFQPRLHEVLTNDSLASAFALLAANQNSPRGRKWFEFVNGNLNNEKNRISACTVLAHTNIPQAAEPLVKLASTQSDVIPFLTQLGNLAVPALTKPVQTGKVWAMDALVDIGTPQAALVLEHLLWKDEPKAYHAAWRLAALLPLSGVEESVRSVNLTAEQRKAKQIEWVWEPFSDDIALQAIAGRLAYLINTTPEFDLPPKDLLCDPRLTLPLCIIVNSEIMREKVFASSPQWKSFIIKIDETKIKDKSRQPSVNDWLNMFKPSEYNFSTSSHVKMLKLLLLLLLFSYLWIVWTHIHQSFILFTWENASALFSSAILLCFIAWVLGKTWNTKDIETMILIIPIIILCGASGILGYNLGGKIGALIGCLTIAPIVIGVISFLRDPPPDYWFAVLMFFLISVIASMIGATFYLVISFLYNIVGLPIIITFLLTWLGSFYLIYFTGKRHEHLAQNLLNGLFEPSSTAVSSRRSSSILSRWLWFR
jgi:hypothetical protein